MDSVHTSNLALGQSLTAISFAVLFFSFPIRAEDYEPVSEADAVEEIVVTGSRIKKRNLVSTSPVSQIDSEEFLFQGVTRVEDLLNDLPQTVADQSAFTNLFATGTATVDLRGLFPVRTLVLLNGRRLPAGSPLSPASDINQIPGMLIERVEVLTGGASATYGSDAIAGVVNFITIEDFEGVQFDYQFSQYTHENKSPLAEIVRDAGYELPPKNVSDGDTHNLSLMLGFSPPDGKGNLTVYATWRDISAVTQSQRDHSACAIFGNDFGDLECGGSWTIPDGQFADFGLLTHPDCIMVPSPTPEDPTAMTCNRIPAFDYATGLPTGALDSNGNLVTMNEPILPWFGNTSGNGTMAWPGSHDFLVEPGTHTFVNRRGHPNGIYNFAPTNYFMRPDERVSAGIFGYYTISDAAEIYLELNYMDDESVAQFAPSGSFWWPDTIQCGNPLLSQQQFDLICGNYNLTTADSQVSFIGRRNVEGGSRRNELQHTQYRAVIGIRGDLGATWSYDAFANYGEVELARFFDDDLSITRMIRAIDAVTDPATGQPVCRSMLDGTDLDCVPWNVFESGAVTQQAVDYITQPLYFGGSTEQIQLNGFVRADLGDYGVVVPTANEGVKVVFGLEYRDEYIEYNPDPLVHSGDVAGFGLAESPLSGGYSVNEVFAEAYVPLIEGKAVAELVSIDLAYRYSNYSTDKETDTYKVAGEWMISPGIRLRGSFQHAVRVGNVDELFRPVQVGFGGDRDTCTGQNPISTLEQCQNTGLTAAQYGTLPLMEGDFFQLIVGGNPKLNPEESDTVSFGVILSPQRLPNFTLSADWFDIDVEGAIAEPDPDFVFVQCLETGLARFCDAVNRDPSTGLLWLGEGSVDVRNINIGALKTSGVDVVADYVQPIGRFGDLRFSVVGTYIDSWQWQELPGEIPYECAGAYDHGPCGRPRPELATNVRSTWISPWNTSISLLWRYTSGVEDESESDHYLPSMDYFDIAGVWDATDAISVRLGVNNVLDEDPPIAPCCGPNTLPGAYDPLGRYWFAGMTFRL